MANLKDKVYALVNKIPKGKVSTYGDIAFFAGSPGAAREVGWALSALPFDDKKVAWWRVINGQGKISIRTGDDEGAVEYQAKPLRKENVPVTRDGKIDLDAHRWRPRPSTVAAILALIE